MKKIITTMLAIAMMATMIAPTTNVKAQGYTSSLPKTRKLVSDSTKGNKTDLSVGYGNDTAVKVTAVKSSNKKVATVTLDSKANGQNKDNFYRVVFKVTMKKSGTTTVSYKIDGKSYKTKLTVAKYVNPVKTFKIGSKSYVKYFKNDSYSNKKFSTKKAKITVKLRSGYSKLKIRYMSVYGEAGKVKTLKNKKTYKFKKNGAVFISYYDKAAKTTRSVTWYFA